MSILNKMNLQLPHQLQSGRQPTSPPRRLCGCGALKVLLAVSTWVPSALHYSQRTSVSWLITVCSATYMWRAIKPTFCKMACPYT